ncbi:MAG: N-acetylmuramic acid 6-phosphate etherase [Bacteroidetes bacterium]|nr:MAG: N-acetylmuramic acid 6-phosphate etherase [Bacteroidota bacterium]
MKTRTNTNLTHVSPLPPGEGLGVRGVRGLRETLARLTTEQRNESSMTIDTSGAEDILRVINNEDKKVAGAVEKEIPYIAKAVDIIVDSFNRGGRLIYVGAGTSGRLGILDASECPPTYGTDPDMVQGIIAGGKKAVFRSQEGVEDKEHQAVKDLQKIKLTKKDVVCGVAASMRTPYVVAAICVAKRCGAKTLYVTTNPRSLLENPEFSRLRKCLDVAICPEVGPEVIMGSTRMKAGTAQKLVLNMLTTASMIRLGKVYENMMVDLKLNSKKLEERAKRVVMLATGVDYDTAVETLEQADGHVKTAIVMLKNDISRTQARKLLKKANGFVRKATKQPTT